jgi:polyisoprenoid-binding protein YceI
MSKTVKILLGVAVVAIGIGALGVWWFFRDDAPAKVSLSTAVESVTGSTGGSSQGGNSSTGDVAGTWVIDSSSGKFDFSSATGTFAGFRIKESLSGIGSTEAVGRTGAVTGSLTIAGDTLTAATFGIDMTKITTNDSRRDDKVQSAVETRTFPKATFVLTSPVPLGSAAGANGPITVTATGDFTVHGLTKPVQVPLEAQLVGNTIVVVGSFDVTFSDYGVHTPTSPIVLSVSDSGTIEFQLLFTRA